MASSVSHTVKQTVILGSANYGATLTVTSAGAVEPTAYGANGIYAGAAVTGVSLAKIPARTPAARERIARMACRAMGATVW